MTTGETYIQVGEISGANKSLIYFSSNGGDKFTVAKFGTVGNLSLMATSDVVNPPTVNPESQYVEVVGSASATDELDDITTWGLGMDSGSVANTYRGCISNYRSSSVANDNSCNVSDPNPLNWTTRYALLSNLEDLKVGDLNAVTDWSVVGLSGLVIPNP